MWFTHTIVLVPRGMRALAAARIDEMCGVGFPRAHTLYMYTPEEIRSDKESILSHERAHALSAHFPHIFRARDQRCVHGSSPASLANTVRRAWLSHPVSVYSKGSTAFDVSFAVRYRAINKYTIPTTIAYTPTTLAERSSLNAIM